MDTPPGYTVAIEGITEPTSFPALAPALGSLWRTLCALPLGWTQHEAYRYFFGSGAVERTEAFLERDGRLQLSLVLLGESWTISVVPGSGGLPQVVESPLKFLDCPVVALLRLDGSGAARGLLGG